MTKEQFDKSRFSSRTEVLYLQTWYRIDVIDFKERWVANEMRVIGYQDISDIREVKQND